MPALRTLIVSFIAWLFRVVKCPEELSSVLNQSVTPILVLQSDSMVLEGLLISLAQRLNQKVTHWTEESAKPGQNMILWVSLHDSGTLERISAYDSPQILRALSVFQLRGPLREWPSHRPSTLWLWGLVPTRRILHIAIGEPINAEHIKTVHLQRRLKIDFSRSIRLVRGLPFQTRDAQARTVLAGASFERELGVMAERQGVSYSVARRAATKAFYEMAANPRRPMYDFTGFIARWLVKRLFTQVETRGFETLVPALKENTVVLVPMHRSHLDYVLVGYKLFSARMNPPLVAAGINLAFWPCGFLFRSVGAYFVKRNARDRFHAMVLRRYVTYLIKRGYLQEFFIEGGRSRSGKMLPPKLGLLSIIIEAWKKRLKKDILFVPVSITYENLVEDETFASENAGRSKVVENFFSLLRALDIFKKKYGDVIIEFGKPLSLAEYWNNESSGNQVSRSAERDISQRFGLEICRAIRNQTNPTLSSLTYTALLMSWHYGLTRDALARSVHRLHSFLETCRKCGQPIGQPTQALQRFIGGKEQLLFDVPRAGIVQVQRVLSKDIFFIPGRRRFSADFYKNSVVHYFFTISLAAISELMIGEITDEGMKKLHEIFEHDLLLPNPEEFSKANEKLFINLVHEGVFVRSANGYRFVDRNNGPFFPGILLSFIQSYMWVCTTLCSASSEEEGVGTSQLIQELLGGFKAASYLGGISRTESGARTAIISVIDSLEARGAITAHERQGKDKELRLSRNLDQDILLLQSANEAIERWLQGEARLLNFGPASGTELSAIVH